MVRDVAMGQSIEIAVEPWEPIPARWVADSKLVGLAVGADARVCTVTPIPGVKRGIGRAMVKAIDAQALPIRWFSIRVKPAMELIAATELAAPPAAHAAVEVEEPAAVDGDL
jgi:hypothetical protein